MSLPPEPWSPADSPFGVATFEELREAKPERIVNLEGLRLEDVASGYWTLPFKQSSGLVSHYGSTPSSSERRSTLCTCQSSCGGCYNGRVSQVAYQLATLRAPDDSRGFWFLGLIKPTTSR